MKTQNLKVGESITEEYTNLTTGEKRDQVYYYLGPCYGFSNLYISENHYYTLGIIGWINVDNYIDLEDYLSINPSGENC